MTGLDARKTSRLLGRLGAVIQRKGDASAGARRGTPERFRTRVGFEGFFSKVASGFVMRSGIELAENDGLRLATAWTACAAAEKRNAREKSDADECGDIVHVDGVHGDGLHAQDFASAMVML